MEPDYVEAVRVLQEALATLKTLYKYAAPDEKKRITVTCQQLSEHLHVLKDCVV